MEGGYRAWSSARLEVSDLGECVGTAGRTLSRSILSSSSALKSSPSKKGRTALLAVKPLGPTAAFSASQIPSEREEAPYDLRGARSYPTLEDEGRAGMERGTEVRGYRSFPTRNLHEKAQGYEGGVQKVLESTNSSVRAVGREAARYIWRIRFHSQALRVRCGPPQKQAKQYNQ